MAPVKEEYLVRHVPNAAVATSESNEERPAPSAPSDDAQMPARKKQKGMNKQREHFRPEAKGVKLCMTTLDGRTCKFGEGCKFSHDLPSYLAAKPADLGETCPIWQLKGHCRFGVTCRYGSSHIAADGTTIKSETYAVCPAVEEELNNTTGELIALLRKNKYDFSRADALSKRILADVQRQQDEANKPKPVPSVISEALAAPGAGTPSAAADGESAAADAEEELQCQGEVRRRPRGEL